jgi:hypothetical protein
LPVAGRQQTLPVFGGSLDRNLPDATGELHKGLQLDDTVLMGDDYPHLAIPLAFPLARDIIRIQRAAGECIAACLSSGFQFVG